MKLISIGSKYQGKFLNYYNLRYRLDNGRISNYEMVSRNNNLSVSNLGNDDTQAVGIIVHNRSKSKVLLQREFRRTVNNYVYEFPGGLIEDGETPEECARRELKEETGLNLIIVIGYLPPAVTAVGLSDESVATIICLADGRISSSPFDDEEIEAGWYNKREVLDMIRSGERFALGTQRYIYQWAIM